ncbi:MAG: Fic family protein [Melioribacteraceae bacterium]|nr:Fic family protein [Melioribacteraceae bacterium]
MKPFVPHKLPIDKLDWESLIPLIAEANRELARYDGILQSISDPEILLAPLSIQEAVVSSRIEGTQATMEDVLLFEAQKNEKIPLYPDIQEVINYRKALHFGLKRIDKDNFPLSLRLIKEMHQVLMDGVRGKDKDPGNFRRIQNWIGKPGSKIEEASFIPPAPNIILPALDNFEKYMHFDEKDRLAQLSIIHAQFEVIHPFLDGNGRLGRILIPLFLYEKKILSRPMFFISAYFEKNRSLYYQKLNAISQDNDWNGWIKYFLSTLILQSKENTIVVKKILSLYEEMKIIIVDLTHSQFAINTLDSIFNAPLFSSSEFIKSSKIPRDSALRILKILTSNKILQVKNEGRGTLPTIYIFNKLFRLVNS